MNIVVRLDDSLKKQDTSDINLVSMYLYLEHEGKAYPSSNWVDNPAIVLGWWEYTIKSLLHGEVGQGLNFMEGSYEIECFVSGKNVRLKSKDGKIDWSIDVVSFIDSLIGALIKTQECFVELGESDMKGFELSINMLNDLKEELGK